MQTEKRTFAEGGAYSDNLPEYQQCKNGYQCLTFIEKLLTYTKYNNKFRLSDFRKNFEFYLNGINVKLFEPKFVVKEHAFKTSELLRYETRMNIMELHKVLKEFPQFRDLPDMDAEILKLVDKVQEIKISKIFKKHKIDIVPPSIDDISEKDLKYIHARVEWLVDRTKDWMYICEYRALRQQGISDYVLCIAEFEAAINSMRNKENELNLQYISIFLSRLKENVQKEISRRSSATKM